MVVERGGLDRHRRPAVAGLGIGDVADDQPAERIVAIDGGCVGGEHRANRIGWGAAKPSSVAATLPRVTRVVARASTQLEAAPERVLGFLRDYRDNRQRILTDNYAAYRVEQGGKGEGTVYAYHFTAGRRERDYRLHVHERTGTLEEQDQMSSFHCTWSVEPAPAGSLVTIESSWDGAGGIAGVFEGFFAPKGLRRIYAQMLDKLRDELR